MALSQITTECRRYGCMKNLLACFANCRYNARCVELRNEIQDKTEQAASDINRYLAEKSVPPIRIQLLTKGLKFVPLSKIEKPKREHKKIEKPKREYKNRPLVTKKAPDLQSQPAPTTRSMGTGVQRKKPRTVQSQPARKKVSRKRNPMSRKAYAVQTHSIDTPESQTQETKESKPKSVRSSRSASRLNAGLPLRKTKKSGKKLFIIIENEAATVVDEQGLMRRMLSGSSSKARFFEAKEVEAQLQIVYKR